MNIEQRMRKLEQKHMDRHKLILIKTGRKEKYSDGDRTYSKTQARKIAAKQPVMLVDVFIDIEKG